MLTGNGVNGSDGTYLFPSIDPSRIAEVAERAGGPADSLPEIREAHRRWTEAYGAVREGLDPKRLGDVGWGLVLPASKSATAVANIKAALAPLIDWRRELASSGCETFFRIYEGEDGIHPGETKKEFLARHRVGTGAADPRQMPYYLLLVGSPEEIPFRIQSQLDVQRGVGRICFDCLDDYARYSANVVAAEASAGAEAPRLLFFGPRNPDDQATALSAAHLIEPLADWAGANGWHTDKIVAEAATKERFSEELRTRPPALLFTASHGMAFAVRDPRLERHQGALLCQDWPGPYRHSGPIPEQFYFSADDVSSEGSLANMIAFHFACFSIGTPEHDEFATSGVRARIADRPFASALPKQLLARPSGALAVVGHVDRAWGYSFYEGEAGRQLGCFEDVVKRLIEGHPVGSALEPLNARYAELTTTLSEEIDDRRHGKRSSDTLLAALWTATNDARNYAVLGDPAVRLSAAGGP